MHAHPPPTTLRSSFSDDSVRQLNPKSPTRSSVLPAAVVPYLRRLDVGDTRACASTAKPPLLSLTLSSPSFLDSKLTDESGHAVYRISTTGTATTLSRADWHSSIRIGDLKWPLRIDTHADSVLVQVRGESWKLSTHILRPGKFTHSPRKFHVPGYPRALKWKRVGSSYWCISASVKGPIASYEQGPSACLKVYETFYDKYDPSPMSSHQGVSTLLLDYLVITALLLVTGVQDWMVVKKYEGEDIPISPASSLDLDSQAPAHSIPHTSATSLQLRKILYGEAIFPKQANGSARHSPNGSSPPSPRQRPYLARSASSSSLLAPSGFFDAEIQSDEEDDAYEFASPERDSDDDDDDDYYYDEPAEDTSTVANIQPVSSPLHAPLTPLSPPSPSAESAYFALGRSAGAPSHTYLDPSFYGETPPVPPIPAQFSSVSSRSSSGSHNSGAMSPSPIAATPLASSMSTRSSNGRRTRELPRPPGNSQSATRSPARSQSTPPREHQSRQHSTAPPLDEYPFQASSTNQSTMQHTRRHSLARGVGSERRQLPTPPSAATTGGAPASAGAHAAVSTGSASSSVQSAGSGSLRSSTLPALSFGESSSAGSSSGTTMSSWLPPQQLASSSSVSRGQDKLLQGGYAAAHAMGIGRSLPPTPIVPKDPHAARQTIFDLPPPAYNSIDFSEKPVSEGGADVGTSASATAPVGSASSAAGSTSGSGSTT